MLRHQQTIETTPKFSNHHGRTISPSMNQQCFGDGQEMSVSKLDVFFSVYVFLPKILRSLNLLLHISLHPSKKRQKAASDFWQMVNMCQILVPEIGPSHPNRTIEKVVPSPPATALGSEGPQCAFSADQAVLS